MPDLIPTTFQPILAHLLQWGELSRADARRLKWEAGLKLLASGNLIQATPDAWSIGPILARLLPAANLEDAWRNACWSLPNYHMYLSGLAAGEIARRGLEGATELVETWVARILPQRTPDFNVFLNAIEQELSIPLSESTPGALVQAVQRHLEKFEQAAGLDFAAWNQTLLGVSAPPEAVFQAALAHGALIEQTAISVEQDATSVPHIEDLNYELAHPCGRWVFSPMIANPDPLQHPNLAQDPAWRKRHYIFSSIPLLGDADAPEAIAVEQVQAAFCQHPVSWIIMQIGLHQHIQTNSGATNTLCLGLERDPNNEIQDLCIELPNGTSRLFSEMLPQLISVLGMHLIMPFDNLPNIAKSGLLESMFLADLLEQTGRRVTLGQNFSRIAFESKYFQMLVKTPKPFRAHLVELLQND